MGTDPSRYAPFNRPSINGHNRGCMNDDETPRRTTKYVSPATQAKREIAALKKAVKAEIKLAKLKAKAGNLRSLLKDIEDAKSNRINGFDIERALRETAIVTGMLNADQFNR